MLRLGFALVLLVACGNEKSEKKDSPTSTPPAESGSPGGGGKPAGSGQCRTFSKCELTSQADFAAAAVRLSSDFTSPFGSQRVAREHRRGGGRRA